MTTTTTTTVSQRLAAAAVAGPLSRYQQWMYVQASKVLISVLRIPTSPWVVTVHLQKKLNQQKKIRQQLKILLLDLFSSEEGRGGGVGRWEDKGEGYRGQKSRGGCGTATRTHAKKKNYTQGNKQTKNQTRQRYIYIYILHIYSVIKMTFLQRWWNV